MPEHSSATPGPSWFVAHEIQYFDTPGTPESANKQVWENLLLVKAFNLAHAYDRAVQLGTEREGGLLTEIRGFVKLTPDEDRWLDSIVRYVGLSDLRPLPSEPRDCLVVEWRTIEPDPDDIAAEVHVPSVSELAASVEREASNVEWFVVELLFVGTEAAGRNESTTFGKKLVLVSATSPRGAPSSSSPRGCGGATGARSDAPTWPGCLLWPPRGSFPDH